MKRFLVIGLLLSILTIIRADTACENSYAVGFTSGAKYKLLDNLDSNDTVVISGIITCGSQLLADVNMNGLDVVTDANGFYTTTVISGWSGTVAPEKYGYTFDPNTRSYTNIIANQIDQNYLALPADDFNDDRRGNTWRKKGSR